MPPIQPAWLAVNPQSAVISGITAANVAIGARLAIKPNVSTVIVVPLPGARRIRAMPSPSHQAEPARFRTKPDMGSPWIAGSAEHRQSRATKPRDSDESEQAGRQRKDDSSAIAAGEIDGDA